MALRIGGTPPLPMEQPEAISEPAVLPETPQPAPAMDMQPDTATMMTGGGTVSPELAHYMGPERMDMACQNCIHFMEPGSCEIVAGPIDPAGICNLFTQDSAGEEELPTEPDMSAEVEDDSASAGY